MLAFGLTDRLCASRRKSPMMKRREFITLLGGTKRAKNTANAPQRLKKASLCAITFG